MESLNARTPDLILMDVQLPGQDGLALTRQLKANPPTATIPIVALTARAMAGDREQAIAAGCIGYITKPINTRTFGDQLREFLPAERLESGVPRQSALRDHLPRDRPGSNPGSGAMSCLYTSSRGGCDPPTAQDTVDAARRSSYRSP